MQTKICKRCLQEKPTSEFGTRKVSGREYLRVYCQKCNWDKVADKRDPEKRKALFARRAIRVKAERNTVAGRPKHILWDAKKSDNKRKRQNDLTLDFVQDMLSKPCSYCGGKNLKMGLDRKDNMLGHIKTNVVPCCDRCNYIRRDMPYEAWLVVAIAIRKAFEQNLFGDWNGFKTTIVV